MQNMQKKFPSENDLATDITHSQKIPKIESRFWLMSDNIMQFLQSHAVMRSIY